MIETQSDSAPEVLIQSISANNLTFRCRVCGLDNSGDPVIFLHGFPETSVIWVKVMQSLAAKGYRCLAPDQRGYSCGARPKPIADYGIDKIAVDAIALADGLGWSKFHLVGHDWGAGTGWTVVQLYPERVQSWTALSIPHMAAFQTAKSEDPDQKQRSRYMGLFQKPLLPEILLGTIFTLIPRGFWTDASDAEIADYKTVFGTFNGRKCTLNWYRANQKLPVQYGDVFLPTVLIWGNKDIAVGRAGVDLTPSYMKGEYSLVELNVGHSLLQENYERVHDTILQHIQSHPI